MTSASEISILLTALRGELEAAGLSVSALTPAPDTPAPARLAPSAAAALRRNPMPEAAERRRRRNAMRRAQLPLPFEGEVA